MDNTKRLVVKKVASLIGDTNWNMVCSVVDDKVNKVSYITDLETMIMIWTPAGPRYFVVKVKEQY